MTDIKELVELIGQLGRIGVELEDVPELVERIARVTRPHPYDVAAAQLGEISDAAPEDLGYKIVVLQRGWVVVGHVLRQWDEITIEDARVIRYWGTTKGLGELADGPTDKTKLDDAGTVKANVLGVVLTIDVTASKWAR